MIESAAQLAADSINEAIISPGVRWMAVADYADKVARY